jgi:hypothetical protein
MVVAHLDSDDLDRQLYHYALSNDFDAQFGVVAVPCAAATLGPYGTGPV